MAFSDIILASLGLVAEGETAEMTTRARKAGQTWFGDKTHELVQKAGKTVSHIAHEHGGKIAGGAALLGAGYAAGKYLKNRKNK